MILKTKKQQVGTWRPCAIAALFTVFAFVAFGSEPASANPGFGQGKIDASAALDNQDPLSISTSLQPSRVEAGGTTELVIQLNLADGFHAYLDRFKLNIDSPDDLKLAQLKISPIVSFMDVVSKKMKDGIKGKATLRALIEIPPGFSAGDRPIKAKLVYQACTHDFCLFPKTKIVETPLTVIDTSMAAAGALSPSSGVVPARETRSSEIELHDALKKSAASAFLFVFVVGLLTSFTPCIYPMIPITLAVLGARAKNHSHLKNFSLALVYVLGIALTYATLGLIAASTGGLFGSALSNPWVVSAVALVFVAMGLSMFGLFELQPPAFVRDRLGAARTTHGYGGAFTTGLIAGIVASPCVGPVLVGILTYIAQTQDRALGFGLLFVFALGLGIPFLVLGLSSSMISRLPKAGPWMEGVKSLFGTVMIAMAFYYIKPITPAWLFMLLLGLTLVTGASVFGAFSPVRDPRPATFIRRGLMIVVLMIGSLLAAVGALNRAGIDLVRPLSSSAPGTPTVSPMNWQPYSDESFAKAQSQGLPILIDFGAEWCAACKEMDATTLIRPRVVELGKSFALFRVDGTEETPELKLILDRYKIQGFPAYLFFDRRGTWRKELSLFGATDESEFANRMSAALE